MKEGKPCDLLKILSLHREFNMTEEEMNELLDPALYIGRCASQVDAYVKKVRPLLEGIDRTSAEVSL